MVEVGSGDRDEGCDAGVRPRSADGLPGLDRTPVVTDDVHGSVGTHRFGDGEEVVGELGQPVRTDLAGTVALAESAAVIGDHVILLGQPRCDVGPGMVGVGPAVHQQDRRILRVPPEFEGREGDAVAGHRSPPSPVGTHLHCMFGHPCHLAVDHDWRYTLPTVHKCLDPGGNKEARSEDRALRDGAPQAPHLLRERGAESAPQAPHLLRERGTEPACGGATVGTTTGSCRSARRPP